MEAEAKNAGIKCWNDGVVWMLVLQLKIGGIHCCFEEWAGNQSSILKSTKSMQVAIRSTDEPVSSRNILLACDLTPSADI